VGNTNTKVGDKVYNKEGKRRGNEGTPHLRAQHPQMNMKVVLVRLLARENRKLVTADMGVAKLLYSSVERVNIWISGKEIHDALTKMQT
jgi:hypothetical protein